MKRLVNSTLILVLYVIAPASAQLQLPKPNPGFKGKVGAILQESIPSYPEPLKAPNGTPEPDISPDDPCWSSDAARNPDVRTGGDQSLRSRERYHLGQQVQGRTGKAERSID